MDEHNNFAIFSLGITHASLKSPDLGKIVGAGFCTMRPEADRSGVNVHCFGESVSLRIQSRDQDEKIINDKLNNYY